MLQAVPAKDAARLLAPIGLELVQGAQLQQHHCVWREHRLAEDRLAEDHLRGRDELAFARPLEHFQAVAGLVGRGAE
eukprot:2912137-Pleurochrysis_carterae.AAC.1